MSVWKKKENRQGQTCTCTGTVSEKSADFQECQFFLFCPAYPIHGKQKILEVYLARRENGVEPVPLVPVFNEHSYETSYVGNYHVPDELHHVSYNRGGPDHKVPSPSCMQITRDKKHLWC